MCGHSMEEMNSTTYFSVTQVKMDGMCENVCGMSCSFQKIKLNFSHT